MTKAISCPRIMAFIAILLGTVPCEGEAVVLTDYFSTGIQGWWYGEDPAGSTYPEEPGAIMSWDPADGNPDPGSLMLSTVNVSTRVEGYWALGPCMETVPNEMWRTQAMVKKMGSFFGHCRAYVSLFDSPDCTGEGTIPGTHGDVPPIAPDVWHFRIWGISSYPAARSGRPVLFMSVSPGTAITCHFDSIVVTNDRGAAATDVPALSAVGLLIMAGLLVAFAVAVLARGRVG